MIMEGIISKFIMWSGVIRILKFLKRYNCKIKIKPASEYITMLTSECIPMIFYHLIYSVV